MTCTICQLAAGILPYKGEACCPDCYKKLKKADRALQKKVQKLQCLRTYCTEVPLDSGYCGKHTELVH